MVLSLGVDVCEREREKLWGWGRREKLDKENDLSVDAAILFTLPMQSLCHIQAVFACFPRALFTFRFLSGRLHALPSLDYVERARPV